MPEPLRMWSVDIAREQCLSAEHLHKLCRMSLEAGYNAIGLYLEHRFQYGFSPFESQLECLGPEDISWLEREFPNLQIIPMVNVLGHMEGFLRQEGYQNRSEERFKGLQSCPSQPETAELAQRIIDSVAKAFRSGLIHIGGDETAALGVCPLCKSRVDQFEKEPGIDGKARLYQQYHQPLLQKVIDLGRQPAIWGDMLLAHPQAIPAIPKQTLIFDWQYFNSPRETSSVLLESGLDVVACPALLSYNSTWLHLPESQTNVADHIAAAQQLSLAGICVTTWEPALMGMMETWLPALRAFGKQINGRPATCKAEYEKDEAGPWLNLMSQLPEVCPSFGFSRIRSGIKCRLLLYSNPFLLWLRQKDLSEAPGDAAKQILLQAEAVAPNAAYRGASEWARLAIEFCQHANASALHYGNANLGLCQTELQACRQVFEAIERIAEGAHRRFGGSRADIWRCRKARLHVESVMKNVRDFGDGNLGYRPSFEHLCHPKFMPHDQGAWWLVNSWANE